MKKIKTKNIVLLCLVAVMVIFFLAMYLRTLSGRAGGLVEASADHTYSWFLNEGEDAMYYTDYAENPGVQYWLSRDFETEEGDDSNVAFDFMIAPSGSESDTLNNLLGNKSTWPDVVNMTYSSMTVQEAYESGYILDLGPYIEECMPNYMAMLDRYGIREDSKLYADGEWRYLALTNFQNRDIMSAWGGYQYRRDWIVKYGTPVAGSQAEAEGGFRGYYSLTADGQPCEIEGEDYDPATVNGDSWVDNVTFPSWERRDDPDGAHGGMKWYADWCAENGVTWDGRHPVTISDWEWMFTAFEKAIREQNISDGYVHSIYYPGYIENGDFVTGFGGIGAHFYYDDDGYFQFGALQEGFKAYLQCMNEWYQRGWIDDEFNTKSTSSFYEIDTSLVRQGKIGCWYGRVSTLGSRIYNPSIELTHGAVISVAAQPINDVYDTEGNAIEEGRALTDQVAMQIPNCFFTDAEYSQGNIVFSKNILEEGKDIKLLLRAIDWLYGEEGSRVVSLGLTKEQLEDASTPEYVRSFYEKYGLSDGAYTVTEENGQKIYRRTPELSADAELWSVVSVRDVAGYMNKENVDYGYTPTYTAMLTQNMLYENTAFTGGRMIHYVLTDAEQKFISQTYSRITTTYLYQEVPAFIKGTKDIASAWDGICEGLITRGVGRSCEYHNKYIRELKGE